MPLYTIGDGNCLYNSVLRFITDEDVTVQELRVRVVVSMIKYWNSYESLFSNLLGPIIEHIKNAVKMGIYSELYELKALCNVLDVNIQSIYPKIKNIRDYNQIQWISHNQILNNINISNEEIKQTIVIMWTNTQKISNALFGHNRDWSPNHFVPLLKINQPEENVILDKSIDSENILNEFNEEKLEEPKPSRKRKSEVEKMKKFEKRKLANKLAMRKRRSSETMEESETRKYNEKVARKRRRMENIKVVNINPKKRSRKEEVRRFGSEWPSVTPQSTKMRLLHKFISEMSQKSIAQQICSICNCKEYASKILSVEIQNIPNFELLKLENQDEIMTNANDNESTNNIISGSIKGGTLFYKLTWLLLIF